MVHGPKPGPVRTIGPSGVKFGLREFGPPATLARIGVYSSVASPLSLSLNSCLLRLISRGRSFTFTEHAAFPMAPPPGPYSGTSTLALVARVSAFSFGVVYGSVKLKFLKAKAKSQGKAEAKAHH
ncbi:hypothetical protein EUGRSUZ_G01742 [Eucalyptus grandis]|uniref:Uncharacterized protein n=2 Tax=Eucalyptus grandis TaxID=71139 RepID=A0ACC3K4P1_EUCGR|nr:hypothetical protein EUGRSUZ_G01742 [Eucalyptus grandis]